VIVYNAFSSSNISGSITVEALLLGRVAWKVVPFLLSRSRDQGQGRYKVKCENFVSPYLRKYARSEVETLHVGRVWGTLMLIAFIQKSTSAFIDGCGLLSTKTALWSIIAAMNERCLSK